jgi:hypothetical protein
MLTVPSKTFSTVILNGIKNVVERHSKKKQAGFRQHRSCVDLINTLRIILEQSSEWN